MHTAGKTMNAYRAGRNAFMAGNYSAAATVFGWASGLDPENPIYSHAAALSAARSGDKAAAEQLFLRATLGTRRTLGADHPFMLLVARDLGAFYRKCGRDDETVELAKRAIALANPLAIARSGDMTLQALADLCGMAGRLPAAIPFFQSALASRQDQYGDGHPKTVSCAARLARIHSKLGDAGKAGLPLEDAGSAGVADAVA